MSIQAEYYILLCVANAAIALAFILGAILPSWASLMLAAGSMINVYTFYRKYRKETNAQ